MIVNNAGYGRLGMIEEVTDDEARAQLDTNFFGSLSVGRPHSNTSASSEAGTSSRSRPSADS